jgi:hypothetical protein
MTDVYAAMPGSRFRVRHGEDGVTEGVLKGVSVLGSGTALVFETDEGTLRYINSSSIEYMDLVESPCGKEGASDSGNAYYG